MDKKKGSGNKIKDKKPPLVSIIVPTYNSQATVKETLDSILNQTYENLQIIVIDNASSDDTDNIIKKIKDKRLKFIKNKKDIKGVGSINKGIPLCKGEYICIFHSDDVYENNIIEKQLEVMKHDKEIGAVFTIAKIIDIKGKVIRRKRLPFKTDEEVVIGDKNKIFNLMIQYGNFLFCPSAMVKKKVYQEEGTFNPKILFVDDQDMWLRILKKNKIAIINRELMRYRVHKNQGQKDPVYNSVRMNLSSEYAVYDRFMKEEGIRIDKRTIERYKKMKSKGYLFAGVCSILGKEYNKFRYNLEMSKETYSHKFPSSFFFIYHFLKITPENVSRSVIIIIVNIMKRLNMQERFDFLNFI